MRNENIQNYWDTVYARNSAEKLGWFQPDAGPSIKMLESAELDKQAEIIDIGGGDSFFAEHLLDLGYTNITIVEISELAIERAKKRLGEKAEYIHWVNANILDFKPEKKFELWHDRAVFHFLTDAEDILTYKKRVSASLIERGKLMLACFSELGPEKCSGLPVTRYSESNLYKLFSPELHMIRWQYHEHITPSKSKQNYVYSCFSKV